MDEEKVVCELRERESWEKRPGRKEGSEGGEGDLSRGKSGVGVERTRQDVGTSRWAIRAIAGSRQ